MKSKNQKRSAKDKNDYIYISKCKHKFCNSQVCTFKARELVSILLTQPHSSHEGAGCQQKWKNHKKEVTNPLYLFCGR